MCDFSYDSLKSCDGLIKMVVVIESKISFFLLLIKCYASKWRRYYRRSTGHCSVLPLGTTAVVLATARYYRSVLPP